MKKTFLTAAALLFFSMNTAVYAGDHDKSMLSGKIVKSHDLTHHVLVSNGKTYQLKFDEPTLLKTSQYVEVKPRMVNEEIVHVDEVIVIRKLMS